MKSALHLQFSTQANFLSKLGLLIDWLVEVAIVEMQVLVVTRAGQILNLSPCQFKIQLIFSELRFLLERPIQLAIQRILGDFAFQPRFFFALSTSPLSPQH